MKYLKFLGIALCAFGFTSCGDFDFTPDAPKINTLGGVTVSMEKADISFFENKGIVKVPFTVTGERNGDITVECTVMEVPETPETQPAMEDAHYIFTSKSVIVAKDDNSGVFEIRLFNDKEINDNRVFEVKLTTTQGCSVTGLDQTMITIKDDDSDPYVRMGGEWLLTLNNGTTQGGVFFDAQEEGTEGYYKYYVVTGIFKTADDKDVELIAKFDYNKTTQEGQIVFEYGQDLPSYDDDGDVATGIFGYLFPYGTGLSLDFEGSANFTWDEAGNKLELVSWPASDYVDEWGADFTYLLHFDDGWSYLRRIQGITGMVRAD